MSSNPGHKFGNGPGNASENINNKYGAQNVKGNATLVNPRMRKYKK